MDGIIGGTTVLFLTWVAFRVLIGRTSPGAALGRIAILIFILVLFPFIFLIGKPVVAAILPLVAVGIISVFAVFAMIFIVAAIALIGIFRFFVRM
jgi:hypothetical protein